MKVSIVTCTYNSERFLRDTLESVKNQTYNNVEHLVVDAGSTDSTLDILKEYPNVTVHTRPPKGISDAMNQGIALATGDLIACLHSDDYFDNDTVIETVVSRLEETGKMWSYGRHVALLSETESRVHDIEPYSLARFFWRNFIHHPTVFVRRELHDQCGVFDTRYKYAMDVDLFHRFLKVAEPLPIDHIITRFRRYGESLTANQEKKAMAEALGVYWRYSEGRRHLFLLSLANFLKKHLYLMTKGRRK